MRVLKLMMIVPFMFMFFSKTQAQGKYGATPTDSIECIKNLNFYTEEYRKKEYAAAYGPWKEALRLCPRSSQNLYLYGVNIMKDHIKNLTDPVQKQAAIDTVFMLFDKRLEYFKTANPDIWLRNKANFVKEVYGDDNQKVYDAYLEAFKTAINTGKGNLAPGASAMIEAKKMYEAKEINDDKFTDVYTELTELVDKRIKNLNSKPEADTVALVDAQSCKSAIENAFISTDAATCENLIKLFTPRFQANQEDIVIVGNIVNILMNRECTNNDLFYSAAEAYNKLDPSPKSAATLAKMFYSKGETQKAIQYYKEAIDGQTDPTDKANYQIDLANIYLMQNQTAMAASYVNQSINLNPRNGSAYYMLANIYASTKGCGNDPVSQRSIFWVAVDVLQKAKQYDKDAGFQAKVNKQINLFTQQFPSYDDCFDRDILDGQSYTVNCGGINAKTIVRTRK